MSVINNELTNDWLHSAQNLSAIGIVEGVQSDSTNNSTQFDVELSCVAINGA